MMKLRKRQETAHRRSVVFVAWWVLGVVLMIGVSLAIVYTFSPDMIGPTFDQESHDRLTARGSPATMADRDDIVAQFTCPCGRCRVRDELRDCQCTHPGGAKEIKTFISERIREGVMTPMQIVDMVSERFGGRKR
jgi:hypothetical protein